MEETSRRGILGRHRSCDLERIDILSDPIDCNHPSRNTSSLLYSVSCKTEDWRSLRRKKYTCHIDFHQRSHYVTIGKSNWVRKLFNNQKEKLLRQPEGEVVRQTKSTQPNQNPIPDRSGRLDNMQDERKTSFSQEINVISFSEEFISLERTG